jgi:2-polyprenyl-3-methyl-5-hydroxy-6-metoxy-1,4-benzoquinol methylase
MAADRYRFGYDESSPYGHAVGLVAAHRRAGGEVVLDLGCGFGAIAEPLAELGLSYVGLDIEQAGLDDIVARGFAAARLDLGDAGSLRATLEHAASGRSVAAITALDIVEHLTNGREVLAALNDFALANGRPPLVVSVPNVTHVDLAAKLLLGRWDVTPTGLLDETHVALYSPERVSRAFLAAGWAETDAHDFELPESDQHFPADAASLAPASPLHDLVAAVRRRAAPGATTNQFVRSFSPVPAPPADATLPALEAPAPLLSALVLTSPGRGALLEDVLVSLDAQSSADLEVVLLVAGALGAEVRAVERLVATFSGGLAARTTVVATRDLSRAAALDLGVRRSRGRYVTVLDDEVVAFAHHMEVLAGLAARAPGTVLRCVQADQLARPVGWPCDGPEGFVAIDAARTSSPAKFDLVAHLGDDLSPSGSYALPRSCFSDLGLSYVDAVAGAEEWEVLVHAAMLCGVTTDSSAVTTLRRVGALGPTVGSPSPDALSQARDALRARLDDAPLLLPRGAAAALRALQERAEQTDATRGAGPTGGTG